MPPNLPPEPLRILIILRHPREQEARKVEFSEHFQDVIPAQAGTHVNIGREELSGTMVQLVKLFAQLLVEHNLLGKALAWLHS